jgi:cytochrome b6-f complex iron-sulfur subunit
MNDVNKGLSRREVIKTLGVAGGAVLSGATLTACAPTANPGEKIEKAGLKIAVLQDFPKPGSYKTFDAAGIPAMIVRTSAAQPDGVSVNDVNLLAFSRQCTHLGCTVNEPVNDELDCPCHGSLFNSQTGDVVRGPAGTPLPKIKLEVRQDGVYAVPS